MRAALCLVFLPLIVFLFRVRGTVPPPPPPSHVYLARAHTLAHFPYHFGFYTANCESHLDSVTELRTCL